MWPKKWFIFMKEMIYGTAASPRNVEPPRRILNQDERPGARSTTRQMKPKILIVDDEPDVVQLIEYNLNSAGYDVITATDGQDALKQARASSPDLVILDLM